MRSSGERTHVYIYIYIYISIVTARPLSPQEGASLTLAPMTYTEVHANFCEQQITVRKVLVLSDTVDTRLEKVCLFRPCLVAHLVTAGHHQGVWQNVGVIHHQMLEVVANGNLILALP